ncbi:hypothetical protein F2Q68_00043184 [Brassica cretica]|uniref:Uncharacterized protein n=1 Tax=Brassica cretica TaxID=69181 RepID=A0A8S9LP81_BRACR|nr:hypothetical protein F2Q68_00043184 [Brassica cretica]
MVARTICEDSVLNHRSKLSWMKCQSTNCQRQVAIDIIYEHTATSKPSQSNRHGWTCLRGITSCSRLASNLSDCERAIRAE